MSISKWKIEIGTYLCGVRCVRVVKTVGYIPEIARQLGLPAITVRGLADAPQMLSVPDPFPRCGKGHQFLQGSPVCGLDPATSVDSQRLI